MASTSAHLLTRHNARPQYQQKGTGKARQGSIRNPHMKGGATVHGPVVRLHEHKLNKKERALGLKSALAARWQEGRLRVVSSLAMDRPRSALVAEVLGKALGVVGKKERVSALIVGGGADAAVALACRNVEGVDYIPQLGCNVVSVLKRRHVVFTLDALKDIQQRLKLAGVRREVRERRLT